MKKNQLRWGLIAVELAGIINKWKKDGIAVFTASIGALAAVLSEDKKPLKRINWKLVVQASIKERKKCFESNEEELTLCNHTLDDIKQQLADIDRYPPWKQTVAEFLTEGRLMKAANFIEVKEIDPEAAAKHLLKARLLTIAYRFSRAGDQYEFAVKAEPSVDSCFSAACFHHAIKEYKMADMYYTRCLDMEMPPSERAFVLNRLGLLYETSNNLPAAEKYFRETVQLYRDMTKTGQGNYLPEIAGILGRLGNMQHKFHSYTDAEATYMEACDAYMKPAATNPACLPTLAALLDNLGAVRNLSGNFAKAEAAYKEALQIYRTLAGTEPGKYLPVLATGFHKLGLLEHANKSYARAEASYAEALEICRTLAGAEPGKYLPHIAAIFNDLALSQHKNRRYSKAAASYREALQVLENLAEKKPAYRRDVGRALCSLGSLYADNGEYMEAEAAFTKALLLYRKLAGKNRTAYRPHIASTLYTLACMLRNNQNDEKAEAAYREAIKIWKQLAAIDPAAYLPHIATALNQLANLYEGIRHYAQAEACIKEALQARRSLAEINPDKYNPDVADTLFNLALLQQKQREYREAEESYKEGLSLRWELSRKDRKHLPGVAASLVSLSALYQDNIPIRGMSLVYTLEAIEVLRRCPSTPETQRLSDKVRSIRGEWKKRDRIK